MTYTTATLIALKFQDEYFSRNDRYSLGTEADSGRYYAAFPVSNGFVNYEEYYELTSDQYRRLLSDPQSAIEFVEACRRREHDDLLLEEPGPNRGTPV